MRRRVGVADDREVAQAEALLKQTKSTVLSLRVASSPAAQKELDWLATAKVFVREGAYVFITRGRQKELDEAVKAIGADVSGVQRDISKLIGVRRITPHHWIRSRVIKPSISIRMGGTQHQGRP